MHRSYRRGAAGFTLTELAIVLAVVGVLAAGLWNLMSGANTQIRDESTASQQSQLISSVKAFLEDPVGQQFMATNGSCGGTCAIGSSFTLAIPSSTNPGGTGGCAGDGNLTANMPGGVGSQGAAERAAWCNYLPPGFSAGTTSPYGQFFGIRVLRDSVTQNPSGSTPPRTFSYMIMTNGGTTISDTSGARISSSIGGDGGFDYAATVCGPPPSWVCGTYGGWSTQADAIYGFGAGGTVAPATGKVASRTYVSPEQNLFVDWLARVNISGDTNFVYNTMTYPEYLGDNALVMGNYTPGATADHLSKSIFMSDFNSPTPPTTGGGNINLQGGNINFVLPTTTPGGGTMNVQGGTINMSDVGTTTNGGFIYLEGGQLSNNAALTPDLSNISLVGNGVQKVLNVTTNGAAAGAQVGVNLGTGCNKTSLTDATCNWALQLASGDESVAGLLYANALYSGTFIYGTLAPPSDIRLKTNIKPLKHALDDIERLKPVSFTMKRTDKPSFGVIAQDLEKVYPDLVVDSPDGYKAVLYDGLIGPLIGAVQELKSENDDLRKELKVQAAREDQLERELKSRQAP